MTEEKTPPSQKAQKPRGDYEVGYGRPPVATRFKPGQCANPKGRPKGSKNLATIAREKLDAKVKVREGGRDRLMSKREIGVTKLVNKFAETGDLKILLALAKLAEETDGPAAHARAVVPVEEREEASNAAILDWFLQSRTTGPTEVPEKSLSAELGEEKA